MIRREAINRLYGLIADINAEEVADHIKDGVSLCDWTNSWRCEAKNALRVLEDTADTSQAEASIITCYGICTNKCGGYQDGKCVLNAKKADIPQTDCAWREPNE